MECDNPLTACVKMVSVFLRGFGFGSFFLQNVGAPGVVKVEAFFIMRCICKEIGK